MGNTFLTVAICDSLPSTKGEINREMGPERTRDYGLIREVLAERPDAWKRFVMRVSDKVWSACTLLTSSDAEREAAFNEALNALRADGFRRLRPYD